MTRAWLKGIDESQTYDNAMLAGMSTCPTAPMGTRSSQVASTAYVFDFVNTYAVTTFNTRSGAVTLGPTDITGAGGALIASPNFTGNPTAPTQPAGNSTTLLATTAFVTSAIAAEAAAEVTSWNGRVGAVTMVIADITGAGGAPLASPNFSGVPAAPTPPPGDSSAAIATTQFVANAVTFAGGVSSFNARTGAVTLTTSDITNAGGALLASPTFTGTPAAPTATAGTNTTQLATTQFVNSAISATALVSSFNTRTGAVTLQAADVTGAGGALLAGPAFTGNPTAPTQPANTNNTTLATTAYVQSAVVASVAGVASFNTRTGAVVLQAADVSGVGGALLAGPAFTGVPSAPTAAPGTNTTQLATCAFTAAAVTAAVPLASSTLPNMDGAVAVGTGLTWARADHVHPGDTNRPTWAQTDGRYLQLTGGTMSGNVTFSTSGWGSLGFSSPNGQGTQIIATTSGSNRINIVMRDGSSETGGNAGSNFAIATYNDSGGYMAEPLQLTRSSGYIYINNGCTVNNNLTTNWLHSTGNINADGSIYASGTVQGGYVYSTGTVQAAGTVVGSYLHSTGNSQIDGSEQVNGNLTCNNTVQGNYVKSTGNADFGTTGVGQLHMTNQGNYALWYGAPYSYCQFGANWYLIWNANNGDLWWNNAAHGNCWYWRNDGVAYNPTSWTGGNGAYVNVSDERVKTGIVRDDETGLDHVLRLQPRRFKRMRRHPGEYYDREELGFVAQEVEQAIPHAVLEMDGYMPGQGMEGEPGPLRGVQLDPIVAALVNSIKALSRQIAALTGRIEALEA